MLSSGTMEREDDAPPKFRQTLAVRPEDGTAVAASATDAMSEGSELMNESVISSVVDK
jgi:hypothetical protein